MQVTTNTLGILVTLHAAMVNRITMLMVIKPKYVFTSTIRVCRKFYTLCSDAIMDTFLMIASSHKIYEPLKIKYLSTRYSD